MLDASSLDTDEVVSVVKERLHGLLRTPADVTSSMAEKVCCDHCQRVQMCVHICGDHCVQMCAHML